MINNICLKFPDFSNIFCDFPWFFQSVQNCLTGKYLPIFPGFPVWVGTVCTQILFRHCKIREKLSSWSKGSRHPCFHLPLLFSWPLLFYLPFYSLLLFSRSNRLNCLLLWRTLQNKKFVLWSILQKSNVGFCGINTILWYRKITSLSL